MCPRDVDDDDDDDDDEIEYVMFNGALDGKETNLKPFARIVDAGLNPAKELVTDAISRRADLIRIEPKGAVSQVVMSVDGIPKLGPKLPKQEAMAVTSVLKLLAGIDIKAKAAESSGGIKAEYLTKPYRVMLKSQLTQLGDRMTVRIIDPSIKLEQTSEIGMGEELRKKIRAIPESKGLLLVVGPAGSGTSTTFYAACRALDAYIYGIFYMSDIGDTKLLNITKFEPNATDSFEGSLARLIRNEGNVYIEPDLKDAETAKVLLGKSDELGMIASFSAKDAAAGLAKLIEWVGEPELITQRVVGVIGQRLIRKLCATCRQAYKPKPEFLKKLGLPLTITVMYRKAVYDAEDEDDEEHEPCATCNDEGYIGRTGMFEYLEMTDAVKAAIVKGTDEAGLRQTMREQKMQTLQRDGLRLVAEGKTSLEELQRIFQPPK